MNRDEKAEIITAEINKRGSVTFRDYMELALYHPLAGYYMTEDGQIGLDGDYLTGPETSPYFGYVLADQAAEMWRAAGKPSRWALVEMGAGRGTLARSIMQRLVEGYGDLFQAVEYIIVEKSPAMKKRQIRTLDIPVIPGRGIRWSGDLKELRNNPTFNGCFYSNELLDAFPVHRLKRINGIIMEVYVTCTGGKPVEEYGPVSSGEIYEYIEKFGIKLEEGQAAEVNLQVRGWLENISAILDKGFLITVDYGDTTDGLLQSPWRRHGTVRSYRNHRLAASPYDHPGAQDITAHINFEALFRWGEEFGFEADGFIEQGYFLMNWDIFKYLEGEALQAGGPAPGYTGKLASLKNLVLAEGMGKDFKVAIQRRGIFDRPDLTGVTGKFGSRLI